MRGQTRVVSGAGAALRAAPGLALLAIGLAPMEVRMRRFVALGMLLLMGGMRPTLGSERREASDGDGGTIAIERLRLAPSPVQKGGDLPLELPPVFEINVGQMDSRVDAVLRRRDLMIQLNGGDAWLRPRGGTDAVQLTFVGRRRRPRTEPLDRLPAVVNYFRGSDPRTWHSRVPTYARVKYADIYRGVDLVYYVNGHGQLEHDLVVAPGASPRVIRFRLEGAGTARIDGDGNLQLAMKSGGFTLRRPVIYQVDGDVRRSVRGGYRMNGPREVGFEIGSYDPARPLWIDPVIELATYLGGSGNDEAADAVVDPQGNTYVTGFTGSPDFPSTGPFQAISGWQDAFVVKIDAAGSLQYCTYLGGGFLDWGRGIALDGGGGVFVAGTTRSSIWAPDTFPTTPGAFQSLARRDDVFVARLDASGALLAATLVGGSDDDSAAAVTVDADGSPYITGTTRSSDFPVASPLQPGYGGNDDAFATKLNRDLTNVEYSTFLGGSSGEAGSDAGLDAAGNLTIVGTTFSSDFPTARPFQASLRGASDAFVTKLDPSGSTVIFSTYFGGALPFWRGGEEGATAIAIDAAGAIVFGGFTNSTDLPTAGGSSALSGPPSPVNGSYEDDAFVAKLTASGELLFATYFGGNGHDTLEDIVMNGSGAIYVTGRTRSSALPGAEGAPTDIGAYRSEDSGNSWAPVRGGLGSASVTALVLDPQQPLTLYAGTERDGVFKSTDGGATWVKSSTGLTSPFITALVVDPANPSVVYAATNGSRVFKTVDAGANWTAADYGIWIDNVISLAIDPTNPATLYAGTLVRGGHTLYKTVNGGDTWQAKFGYEVPAVAVDPSRSSTVYAATSVFLYKSTDGASTWSRTFEEASHLAPLTSVIVDPASPATVYLGTYGRGVFKTTDGGTTWAAANAGLTYLWISTLALDPSDHAIVYAGTDGRGVFKSIDGGATWAATNTGISSEVVTQIAVNTGQPANIHAGVNGLYGDAYVGLLSGEGAPLYSVYVGGNRSDVGSGIAVAVGRVHLVGTMRSPDWTTSAGALQPESGGGSDAFISRMTCLAPLTLSSLEVSAGVLWPPDHRLVPVSLDYQVTGGCGAVTCTASVASNEPVNGTGDGDAEPDWEVIDSRTVRLRAERSGQGSGRTYSLSVNCSDGIGRRRAATAVVAVPLSFK